MAVYREGYHALKELQSQSIRNYNDACDLGVPVRKNDKNWKLAKMLFAMYGDETTRQQHNYSTGKNVYANIKLIDEWAVSDGIKTIKQATENYTLVYVTCKTGNCKGFDGYITIDRN